MLPDVNIQFENGNLGRVTVSPDGIFAVVAQVADEEGMTLQFSRPNAITSLADLAALGLVDSIANHAVYKFFMQFYNEVGEGALIYLIPIAQIESLSSACEIGGIVENAIRLADKPIRGIYAVYNPVADEELEDLFENTDGLYPDVWLLMANAQPMLEAFLASYKQPMFMVIDGFNFNGQSGSLRDLSEMDNNRVAIVIGDTESRNGETASRSSALGLVAGRLAKYRVHVNIGKVLNGALTPDEMFIVNVPVKVYNVGALHDKGYISFRTHSTKSGFFFTDDPQASSTQDDYRHITNRRVIDKAFRIAYGVLINEVLADIPVTNTGAMTISYARDLEGRVVRAIAENMTNFGELSVDDQDPLDFGAICEIDTAYNLVRNSTIKLNYLRVRPKGYARTVDVPLGFVAMS